MRCGLLISLVGGVVANIAVASAPALADWHSPYVYRETSGTWTNVEFDDGVCHIYYSHNTYDNNTKVNRSGDCSNVAIGPDGTPVYGAPLTELPR